MRKEASCRGVLALFEQAKKRGIPIQALRNGVDYPLSVLCNKRERIEWDVFCRILENFRPYLTDAEFIDLGYDASLSGSLLTALSTVGRVLFTCSELYWWMNTTTKGPGSQLFNCFVPTTQEVGRNHLRVTLTLEAGHHYCREFFLLSQGGLEAISVIAGLQRARVERTETEFGAVYEVFYPEERGARSWLRRAVTWPFATRKIARELKDANEILLERYSQLEEAQTKIQHQATQLRTAFSITKLIRSNLDLDATVGAVAKAFVDEARFVGATVMIAGSNANDNVHRLVSTGRPTAGMHVLSRTLEARGQALGELRVWLAPNADQGEANELLDQIVPSVAIEINDALSYTLLSEYRARDKLDQQEFSRHQLDSQERERKRLAGELHDGLGQDLLVASNQLQQYLREINIPDEGLLHVASLLQSSINGVREISANLHPHHLDRLGFSAAVEAMMEKLERTSGLTVATSCDNIDGVLPKETELHLFRIIQEALTNVVRHASAQKIFVAVKRDRSVVEITVTDDGVGFGGAPCDDRGGSEAGEVLHGFGLSSMTERARIIGGIMKIETSPGKGTAVHVLLPLPERDC